MKKESQHNVEATEHRAEINKIIEQLNTLQDYQEMQEHVSSVLDEFAPRWLCILTGMKLSTEDGKVQDGNSFIFGVEGEEELVQVLTWSLKQPVFYDALNKAIMRHLEEIQAQEAKKIIVPGLKIEH